MKSLLTIVSAFVLFTGCSATWSGVKEDTTKAVTWTKGQVNEGATYVKAKTE